MTTDNLYCKLTACIAAMHGVKTVYCSPGSRNAPLLIAMQAHPGLECRVVVDERSAAFMALGESLVSRKPVMLVCTSGTAMLNYAPAIAEAYYCGIPLIVVTADRPPEWIDQDDSQTLRQLGALSNFVKGNYDLPVYKADLGARAANLEWFVERELNDAMLCAMQSKRGPVHINIRLDAPLGGTVQDSADKGRYIGLLKGNGDLTREQMKELAEGISSKKVLLLCGFSQPDNVLKRSVATFASLPNVAVMAETLSNVATGRSDWHMVDSLLSRLNAADKEALKPDAVITIGGALVSRMVKEWLRNDPPGIHWHVGYTAGTVDCLKSLTTRIECDPARFLRQLAGALRHTDVCSGYNELWRHQRDKSEEANRKLIAIAPWSDLKAFSIIKRHFPPDANLFLSNGTCVRYDQLFGIRSHATFCNRGVSGIDGCTSTAVGGALAANVPTVLITGDMSFAYDISALTSPLLPQSLKIIVINNEGGGIFRFIGSTSRLPEHILHKYFCAPPVFPLPGISEAFGIAYFHAESETQLPGVLNDFFKYPGTAILEIATSGANSARILKSFLK